MSTTNGNGNGDGAVEEVIERLEARAVEPALRLIPGLSLAEHLERRAAARQRADWLTRRRRDEEILGESGEC